MQNKPTKYLFAVASVGIVSFLTSATITSSSVSAYSASISTNNNITLNVSPIGSGTSIHPESINVVSDCRSGYNLAIATPEGSDLYADGDSSNSASFTAVDGTSALNSNNNTNKWGYTMDSNPTNSTVFSPLSSTASVLKTSAQTVSPDSDIDDTFSINYGVKVNGNIAPGTYQMQNNGAIVYYLTTDVSCANYTISFNPNGGTGSVTTQELGISQTGDLFANPFAAPTTASYTDADNNTITGDADKFWLFWGWNTQADGTGDWYKDQETVTNLLSTTDTITLYAQWKQATLADMTAATAVQPGDPKQIDHNLMQDMQPETCYNSTAYATSDSSPAHTPYDASTNPDGYHTIALLDYRGKVTTGSNPESPEEYSVTKLPDNLCWMTKNLNLGRQSGGPNGDGTITLTSDDTDLDDDTTFTLPVSPTTYTTGSVGYYTPQIFINHSVPQYTVNSVQYSPIVSHYSWAAAIATNTSGSSGNVTTSICPKNWDLPTTIQLYNLRTKGSITSATIAHSAPYNFVYGGYRNGASSFYYETSYGYYWTSTNYNSSYAFWNYAYSSGLYNGYSQYGYKHYGAFVRCVTSQGKATIHYNGNGTVEYPVTGVVTSQENVEIASARTQFGSGFTRANWTFKNWNTAPDGSGTTISADATIDSLNLKPGETITLYAQWTPQRQIIYNDNCSYNNAGCATNTDTTGTSNWTNAGNSLTLGSKTYFTTRTDYAIVKWNTARDGSGTNYNPGSNYTVPSSLTTPDQITLYAQWAPQYTITYVNNCMSYVSGNASCTQSVSDGTSKQKIDLNGSGDGSGTLAAYNKWTLSGWKIKGWSTVPDNSAGTYTEYPVSGTYSVTGQGVGSGITLYAHWVPLYTIQYDGNGADNPNGMGTTDGNGIKSVKQTNVGEGDSVTLLASNFRKSGYGFAGWSTSPTATVGGGDKIYGPNETISAPTYPNNATNTITMYAVWIAAAKDGNNNPIYLQDWNNCSSLTSTSLNSTTGEITPGSVIALTDKRNNEVYTIAKLADDKCWMVENLRLGTSGTVGNNINDPNATNESLSQGYGKYPGYGTNYGNFAGLATSETSNFSNSSTANSLYSTTASGNKTVIGTSDYPSRRFPRYNNSNTASSLSNPTFTENYANASNPSTSGTYKTSTIFSYGNYYTWAAAMANTQHFYQQSESERADTSICPAGWVLPTSNISNGEKDYSILTMGYGGNGGPYTYSTEESRTISNRLRSFPTNFILSGYYSSSSATNRGISGNYWSRTTFNSSSDSYHLKLTSTTLNPNGGGEGIGYKYNGLSIRCLSDNAYDIQYDGNGADNPNGMGITDGKKKSVRQTKITEGLSVTLLPSNFKRTGYGFAGWSTDSDAWAHFTDNDNSNDPIIYGPMETITAPNYSGSNILTLYAVWVPAKKDGNNDPVYLQDFGISECNSLTSTSFDSISGKITANKNSVVALTDQRDNEVYTVAKLADNNCWMVENLRLEHEGTVGNNINDPNVTNESLSEGYGGTPGTYGSFVGLAEAEPYPYANRTSNSIYKSSANPPVDTYDPSTGTLEDIGTQSYPIERFPRYDNQNIVNALTSPTYIENHSDPSTPATTGTYKTSTVLSYGNFYNWAATMANTNPLTTSNSESAGTSICPAGWTLPTSGSATKDFGSLSQAYGGTGDNQSNATNGDIVSSRFSSFPNNFLFSGQIYNTSNSAGKENVGTIGYYWSKSKEFGLILSKNSLYPSDGSSGNEPARLHTVRCILDSP